MRKHSHEKIVKIITMLAGVNGCAIYLYGLTLIDSGFAFVISGLILMAVAYFRFIGKIEK